MKKSNIIIIAIIVVVYSVLLALFGAFGTTIQSAILWVVKNILPYLCMVFGYFLTIFVPIRVISALDRNKKERENVKLDDDLQRHADSEKRLKNQIMNVLGDKDEF